MSTTQRWFLVPVVQKTEAGSTGSVPKYESTAGIESWSGQNVTANGNDRYVVRMRGTVSALDAVEAKSDATSLQEAGLTETDVATELNELTGHSYTFAQWEDRFLTR